MAEGRSTPAGVSHAPFAELPPLPPGREHHSRGDDGYPPEQGERHLHGLRRLPHHSQYGVSPAPGPHKALCPLSHCHTRPVQVRGEENILVRDVTAHVPCYFSPSTCVLLGRYSNLSSLKWGCPSPPRCCLPPLEPRTLFGSSPDSRLRWTVDTHSIVDTRQP